MWLIWVRVCVCGGGTWVTAATREGEKQYVPGAECKSGTHCRDYLGVSWCVYGAEAAAENFHLILSLEAETGVGEWGDSNWEWCGLLKAQSPPLRDTPPLQGRGPALSYSTS